MNNGGQEGGSSGGSQGSTGGQNAGSNGGQATTTTAQQNQQTTTAGFQTSTTSQSTHGPTSTSTSASSSSSGVQKGVVIGAVVGGLCLLLVLALIGVCLMQRRKKKQIAQKNSTTEPVTYAGLNSAFTGVPFTSNQERPNSLVPEPLSLHPSSTGSGVALRGGEASPYATSPYASEGDHFLPSYAESQSDASRRNRNSLGRIDTSGTPHDSPYVSPLSTGTFTPRSQAQTYQPTPTMPSMPTPGRLMRSETSDTMGFPNDNPYEGLELPPMPRMPAGSRDTVDTMGFPVSVPVESQLEVPVISPRPVHPMVRQNSLERIAVQHTGNTSSPTLGYGDAQGSRSHTQPPSTSLNQTYNGGAWSGSGLGRNISQRTVDSVSSYAPPMVSDEELERLGVGSSHGPKR